MSIGYFQRSGPAGVVYALAAFGTWGIVLPIHFKLLSSLPAAKILAHRIVWASVLALMLVAALHRVSELAEALRSRRVAWLALSALLVGGNWLVYIWAVNAGQLVQTSLGYFINPLVSVVLAILVLRERLRPLQIGACAFAAAGVLVLVVVAGIVPWIALALASSFGVYGLIRKKVSIDPLVGFSIESLVLLPFALSYLSFEALNGNSPFAAKEGWMTASLLVLTGVTTAAPLIWFAAAAQRLQLSTIGLLQFLAPSCTLVVGTLGYGEPFRRVDLMAFAAIWIALAIYSADALAPYAVQRRNTAEIVRTDHERG
jgi:chloramphenicol-sensitive protein RarD